MALRNLVRLESLLAQKRWALLIPTFAGDLLCYCNDVMDLAIDGISAAMSQALLQVRRIRAHDSRSHVLTA